MPFLLGRVKHFYIVYALHQCPPEIAPWYMLAMPRCLHGRCVLSIPCCVAGHHNLETVPWQPMIILKRVQTMRGGHLVGHLGPAVQT